MEHDMDAELRLFSSLNSHFSGTYRWMAPEVVRREAYSNMADVYSFAIMMWQFVTHEEPYCDLGAAESACLVAGEMLRPPMPERAPALIRELIEANWSDDPKSRWKFERVAETLKTLQGSLSPQEKTWLESAHGHPVYHQSLDEEEQEPPKAVGKPGKGGQKKDSHRAGSLLGGFFGMKKK
jgi:serine/threonine protein kinase